MTLARGAFATDVTCLLAVMTLAGGAFATDVNSPDAALLFGLELVHNSPARPGLVKIDRNTAEVSIIGDPNGISVLPACGDLVALDSKRGLLYYLGDTEQGTTLAGVSISNGSLACSAVLPIREIGFVGFGQSVNFDATTDELIVSGVVVNTTTNATAHLLMKGPASNCGPVSIIGRFGDADYVPMEHASAYDPVARLLYIGLATGSSSFAVGIIDVDKGEMKKLDVEDSSSGKFLVGMKWHAKSGTLIGLQNFPDYNTLNLVQLSPQTGKWSIKKVTTDYPVLMGNSGSVSAFDSSSDNLFILLAANTTSQDTRLGQLRVSDATISMTPSIHGELGLGLILSLIVPDES